MIDKRVTKYFPGHGAFHGTVKEHGIKTDNYLVVYDDGDRETIKYPEFLHILPGHPEFISTQANFIALSSCLEQEIKTLASTPHTHTITHIPSLSLSNPTHGEKCEKAHTPLNGNQHAMRKWTVFGSSTAGK
jgi:hypothetical protein